MKKLKEKKIVYHCCEIKSLGHLKQKFSSKYKFIHKIFVFPKEGDVV